MARLVTNATLRSARCVASTYAARATAKGFSEAWFCGLSRSCGGLSDLFFYGVSTMQTGYYSLGSIAAPTARQLLQEPSWIAYKVGTGMKP